MNASHRQKKILTFFGIKFASYISSGAAGWEIGSLLNKPENKLAWNKYQYLTNDFSTESDQLKPFDRAELNALQLPENWTVATAEKDYRSEIVLSELSDGSPFDAPPPEINFQNKVFMFTGKFMFGDRAICQATVESLGGSAPDTKTITSQIDYLVIGTAGSRGWRMGEYGNKIERAILLRREKGAPAIVSEDEWIKSIKKANYQ
jgi:NAD-dependent DNA ligase